jgi:MazG family protein
MQRLLSPDGCPWDREQTLHSLKPFLIEEAYEVIDAIDEADSAHHREELGDLLFQIVFQAELGGLSIRDVVKGIGEKLIRRHPHVFGEAVVRGSDEVLVNWERIKQSEHGAPRGLLRGVPKSMPALQKTQKLTTKAAKVGFDWPAPDGARRKLMEELEELRHATESGDAAQVEHELGDLLFAAVNWARKLDIDAEQALRKANERFERRFGHIERALADRGRTPSDSDLDEMDHLWDQAKEEEQEQG